MYLADKITIIKTRITNSLNSLDNITNIKATTDSRVISCNIEQFKAPTLLGTNKAETGTGLIIANVLKKDISNEADKLLFEYKGYKFRIKNIFYKRYNFSNQAKLELVGV